MDQAMPKVSIGMAVYNGEKYLAQAIDSILAQTFSDFELIISDNASTDRTAEICQQYALADKRIRYHRNPVNIGGANNENQTFRMSRGAYFRWAAHDDLCAPELLEKCAAVLDQDPSIVLCHSYVVEIDDKGHPLKINQETHGTSKSALARFAGLSRRDHACEETYGLVRSEIMRKTELQMNYTGSDRTFLCELSLYGPFHQIKEPLFYKRYHQGNVYVDYRARMAWFTPSLDQEITLPNWSQLFDYFRTIGRARVSWWVKLQCFLFMAYWLLRDIRFLAKDLIVAAYLLLHSKNWRKHWYASKNNWS
jgi:glycosyltransferase involved in cell wall biosynthesis